MYNESIKQAKILYGEFFLLGMGLGKHCQSEDTTEIINWLERNFGHDKVNYLVSMIKEAEKDRLKCTKCNERYERGAKFCSSCGESLTVLV